MQVSLKPGERIFINGAVLRVDRKVTIELMNDVTFLLESHVMQAEQATTPLRQLYFVIQTMLMEPSNIESTQPVFKHTHGLLLAAFENPEILEGLKSIETLIEAGRYFEALKTIRGLYDIEEAILSGGDTQTQEKPGTREVA